MITLLAVAAISTTAIAQIPNGGFENWNSMGSYDNPADWSTMNNKTATQSMYTATKGTPGSPGNSYLKLTSKTIGAVVVPGIAVCGRLDTMSLQPISGVPFTQRPATFTGKWQHMIYGSSQGSVKVITTKWNTTMQMRDTIAHAEQTLGGMAMNWSNFSMNLMYMDSLNYPDSLMIILNASGSNPTNNDYLWADNLAFSGTVAVVVQTVSTVGVKEVQNNLNNFALFPNPAKESVQVSLSLAQSQPIHIEIFDLTGKLVQTVKKEGMVGEFKEKIDVKDLPKGTYLFKVSGNSVSETKKIVIE